MPNIIDKAKEVFSSSKNDATTEADKAENLPSKAGQEVKSQGQTELKNAEGKVTDAAGTKGKLAQAAGLAVPRTLVRAS